MNLERSPILKRYKATRSMLNGLELKQRQWFFAAGCAVIAFVAYLVFISPVLSEKAQINGKLSLANKEVKVLNAQLVAFMAPDTEKQTAQRKLNEELAKLEQTLNIYEGEFLSTNELVKALKEILTSEHDLELKNIQLFPLKTMAVDGKDITYFEKPLHEQTIELTLQGTYFNFLRYLDDLEASSLQFFWDDVDYRVELYPDADILLKIRTITQDKTNAT